MTRNLQEPTREFYSEEYFLAGSGGAKLFQESKGTELDVYKRRVISLSKPNPGERILDLGCGRGEIALACLRRGCEVWALDFSRHALELTLGIVRANDPALEPNLHLIECDAAVMAFEAGFFDCVITSDFVEHIAPDRYVTVVERVHRALKTDARFVVHTSPSTTYIHFGQYVARMLEWLQGRPVLPIIDFKQQLEVGGHCNIQSVRSLRHTLRNFSECEAWAEFSQNTGRMKGLIDKAGMTPLLAHHLYAIALK